MMRSHMSMPFPTDAVRPDWRMPRPLRVAARAIAEGLFYDARTDRPPSGDHLDWLMDESEAFLAHAGVQARTVFQASVLALTTLAPPSAGKLPPLGRLTPADRAHAIHRFESTPFGLAVLAAKAILCIHHYEAPEAREQLGFDGECMGAKS